MAKIRLAPLLQDAAADTRGATMVEFAIIAPTLLLLIFGVFDLGYNMYETTQLEGTVQRAARASAIEGATPATIDDNVRDAVHDLVPDATVRFSRRAYSDYADVARPEDFSDLDNDGRCDNGEPFEDVNGNALWDSDRASAGQGGARDAVLYEVTVSFERPFPLASMIGLDPTVTSVARTILRNQPYAAQRRQVTVGNCP